MVREGNCLRRGKKFYNCVRKQVSSKVYVLSQLCNQKDKIVNVEESVATEFSDNFKGFHLLTKLFIIIIFQRPSSLLIFFLENHHLFVATIILIISEVDLL